MSGNGRKSIARSDLERQAWPDLSGHALDVLSAHGTERDVAAGDVIWEVGQPDYPLVHLIDADMNIVDRGRNDSVVVTITAGNFTGELGLLMGQHTFFAGVMASAGRIVSVSPAKLRHLIATVPEVSDIIVSAFAARRKLLVEWADGALTIIGDENERTCLGLREYASRNRIPFRFIEHADRAAVDIFAAGRQDLPTHGTVAVVRGDTVLHDPSPLTLAKALGYELLPDVGEVFDLAVIGAGPGGLAAAVYGASEGLKTLVIDDTAIGGQAGTSSRIENYLGFPTGISGSELAYLGEIQAIKFGARVAVPHRAAGMQRNGDVLEIALEAGGQVRARAAVVASGARYRKLPLSNLADYEGNGVYYAATELEARYANGTNAVIVGGGNSAGQAAMFLSRHAEHTYIVVRRDGLSETMSDYLSSRIARDPRITLVTRSQVTALRGESGLTGVTLTDRQTGETRDVACRALYVMVGAEPNAAWAGDMVSTDENGFVLTGAAAGKPSSPFATSAPGVFAVGDIRSGSVKRVASSVGEGSVVVSAVHGWLAERSNGEPAN
ncbi:MAG: FAD-dependent oxidoreductase [Roseitalea sp.]|jgi:thioredoxin reductase (NADPH)|nr:FAD-dependent oxidoreductase [Roseitalea sp.]MBO6720834.1 FAD-dependent oxidoreductase [Roseitalea sp.]MBO6743139.1 FAD-dependent oxidoreductase [Roseitalea sp.]